MRTLQIFNKGDKVETPLGVAIVRELVTHGGEFAYIVGALGDGGRDTFSVDEVGPHETTT